MTKSIREILNQRRAGGVCLTPSFRVFADIAKVAMRSAALLGTPLYTSFPHMLTRETRFWQNELRIFTESKVIPTNYFRKNGYCSVLPSRGQTFDLR